METFGKDLSCGMIEVLLTDPYSLLCARLCFKPSDMYNAVGFYYQLEGVTKIILFRYHNASYVPFTKLGSNIHNFLNYGYVSKIRIYPTIIPEDIWYIAVNDYIDTLNHQNISLVLDNFSKGIFTPYIDIIQEFQKYLQHRYSFTDIFSEYRIYENTISHVNFNDTEEYKDMVYLLSLTVEKFVSDTEFRESILKYMLCNHFVDNINYDHIIQELLLSLMNGTMNLDEIYETIDKINETRDVKIFIPRKIKNTIAINNSGISIKKKENDDTLALHSMYNVLNEWINALKTHKDVPILNLSALIQAYNQLNPHLPIDHKIDNMSREVIMTLNNSSNVKDLSKVIGNSKLLPLMTNDLSRFNYNELIDLLKFLESNTESTYRELANTIVLELANRKRTNLQK